MEFVRIVYVPEITFSDWAANKGIQPNMLARDYDYAQLFGGSFTARTSAAKGKLQRPINRIVLTQQMKAEYDQEIATEKIKKFPQAYPLDWNREADRAYVRMKIKRSKNADEKTAWQHFYDNQFYKTF